MINAAPIRAAARACDSDIVGISKEQLEQLLDEIEEGQRARRELRILEAITPAPIGVGIDGVSRAG